MTSIFWKAVLTCASAVNIPEGLRGIEGKLIGPDADDRSIVLVKLCNVEVCATSDDRKLGWDPGDCP
jgi:hypothetical protein